MGQKPIRLSPKTFCTVLPEATAAQLAMLRWVFSGSRMVAVAGDWGMFIGSEDKLLPG